MPKLMQRLGLRERLRETEVIEACLKMWGDFIAAHSARVALRETFSTPACSNRLALQARTNFKTETLRKLKQSFGGKTIRDIRFRVG